MIKVGFIDYFLDEWHANEYPGFFAKQSDNVKVTCAYGHIQPPMEGKISNEEWAEKKGIELKKSIEEVIEDSDCLVVLSPDNPESTKNCANCLSQAENAHMWTRPLPQARQKPKEFLKMQTSTIPNAILHLHCFLQMNTKT